MQKLMEAPFEKHRCVCKAVAQRLRLPIAHARTRGYRRRSRAKGQGTRGHARYRPTRVGSVALPCYDILFILVQYQMLGRKRADAHADVRSPVYNQTIS